MSIAVVDDQDAAVFEGDEATLLNQLDADLARREPGVIVTWNGARFDLPFIADRAEAAGVRLGLSLWSDPALPVPHEPLLGHTGGYRAQWHDHRHLDAYLVYRADVGASLGWSCSLKRLSRAVGLSPVEVDRTAIHELSSDELRAYVVSDAALTRTLALRRWSTASRAIDHR